MDWLLSKNLIFLPLITSFLVAFILTPLAIKIAWRFGLVDNPKTRKHPAHLYQKTIPRAGGLPIYLAIIATSLIFLPFDIQLKGILAGATVMIIIGLFDDRFDLNPYLRFILNFLAAGLVVTSGIGIKFITNPFGGIINLNYYTATLVALFWIVFLANIVNWSKGFDGQLPGIVVIACLTVAAFSFRYSADITQWPIAILASITAGAYLGFLPYNFYPQKIMPGYGGKTIAGFMLAVLSILSTAKIATLILVLGIPLIDAVYLVIKRIASGRSPAMGGREHLHHRLLALGWGKRKIAFFYWTITLILAFMALQLNSKQKFYTMFMLIILFSGGILWLNYLSTFSKRQDRDSG